MDKGVKIKTEGSENKTKTFWKYVGYGAIGIFLALITVIVINI